MQTKITFTLSSLGLLIALNLSARFPTHRNSCPIPFCSFLIAYLAFSLESVAFPTECLVRPLTRPQSQHALCSWAVDHALYLRHHALVHYRPLALFLYFHARRQHLMPVLVPAVVVTALFYPFRNKQSAVEHEYQFMSILNVKTVLLIPWS